MRDISILKYSTTRHMYAMRTTMASISWHWCPVPSFVPFASCACSARETVNRKKQAGAENSPLPVPHAYPGLVLQLVKCIHGRVQAVNIFRRVDGLDGLKLAEKTLLMDLPRDNVECRRSDEEIVIDMGATRSPGDENL